MARTAKRYKKNTEKKVLEMCIRDRHSFYQLLHQGTDIVPLQFIRYRNNQMGTDVVIQDSTSQQKLCANVAAQIVAFACGKSDENSNKNFEGGRPSSIDVYKRQILYF